MFEPIPLTTGVIGAAITLIAGLWWVGIYRRRHMTSASGIAALATMKWRECAALVLESLTHEGYIQEPSSQQPGGCEFLLRKNNEHCLLTYKHGTAYRLGEANIRDFANTMKMQGASRGIIVTLGTWDRSAYDSARKHHIELLDGAAIWPKVSKQMPSSILAHIESDVSVRTRQGVLFSFMASALVGSALGISSEYLIPAENNVATTSLADSRPAQPSSESAAHDAAVSQDIASATAAAEAMRQVASLSDDQRSERRVRAASEVARITHIRSAIWSTQSTLVLTLNQGLGEEEHDLIAEACRVLVQYEELRFTRLQLESPVSSHQPIRWRRCQ